MRFYVVRKSRTLHLIPLGFNLCLQAGQEGFDGLDFLPSAFFDTF